MIFRDEVKIDPRLIGELQNVEMIFVELDVGERRIVVLLHVVKKFELHEQSLSCRFFQNLQQGVVVHSIQREFFYLGCRFGPELDNRTKSGRRYVRDAQGIFFDVFLVGRV